MKRFGAWMAGGVVGLVAGFFFALGFGEMLFDWHDNIGPEIRFALFSGLFGSCIGLSWRLAREQRNIQPPVEDRDD